MKTKWTFARKLVLIAGISLLTLAIVDNRIEWAFFSILFLYQAAINVGLATIKFYQRAKPEKINTQLGDIKYDEIV